MKAVKVYNIKWDFSNVKNVEEVKDNLPLIFGFKVPDDFDVPSRVANALQKKYGVEVKTFSYDVCHIFESVEEMLKGCAPADEKEKNVFTSSGKLTGYGKKCFEIMNNRIKQRVALEDQGVLSCDMPVKLDQIMLSFEKISGMSWDKDDHQVIIGCIIKKIRDAHEDVAFRAEMENAYADVED